MFVYSYLKCVSILKFPSILKSIYIYSQTGSYSYIVLICFIEKNTLYDSSLHGYSAAKWLTRGHNIQIATTGLQDHGAKSSGTSGSKCTQGAITKRFPHQEEGATNL